MSIKHNDDAYSSPKGVIDPKACIGRRVIVLFKEPRQLRYMNHLRYALNPSVRSKHQ